MQILPHTVPPPTHSTWIKIMWPMKEETWTKLRELKTQSDMPWLSAGDFNEVLFAHEKEGRRQRTQASMDKLKETLEFCELHDLCFEGDNFTWRNHNHMAEGYIRERLDRAMANDQWRSRFPMVRVINGDPRHSDHRLIIINTDNQRRGHTDRVGDGGFKFEAKWLMEENYNKIVGEAWGRAMEGGEVSIQEAVKMVAEDLSEWNKNVLGDLEKRIKKVKKELENLRRAAIGEEGVAREAVLLCKLERLEDQVDVYWRQRSHNRLLWQGDRNTAFFHAAASETRRRNKIKKLRREDGSWVEGESEKWCFIANYFSKLFRSNGEQNVNDLLVAVEPKVQPYMNELLLSSFTASKVKEALDAIGDLKAPGPDGMPSVFYKNCWDLVGNRLTNEVLTVLNGGPIPDGWNDTNIVLIPKVPNPETVKDLMPISLCNVTYKLISKVLANRLKKILPDIISPSQSAFVPGQLISDNILIAYEMVHYMRNKMSGVGYAAVKLDMSKAYDRVEWRFLEEMMVKMGFHTEWVQLIMKCVSSIKYHIRVNDEYTEAIIPERGLRQGDSLSPYLFLIRAEGFSALLDAAEREGRIGGVRICPTAPSVSHLLFADDSLLLIRANEGEAQQLQSILSIYERCSGQTINKDKSAIMFSTMWVRVHVNI